MSKLLAGMVLLLLLGSCKQDEPASQPLPEDAALAFDSVLAARYGADDYGMKTYVLALLKRGPNRDLPKAEAQALQRAHLENIQRLAEAGTLVLAGPFLDTGDLRGLYVFDVSTLEEAEALIRTDPAIVAGTLLMELRPWYGSAALMDVNSRHQRLARKAITE